MHRTLERQIKKFLPGVNVSAIAWENFFKAVNEAYTHFDEDRKLMSRSLDLSSKEQVEVNDRLAKEKAKDEAILSGIGDGVIAVDETGKVLFINRAAQDLLGIANENITGQPVYDIVVMTNEQGQTLLSENRPIDQALKSGQTIKATSASTACYYVKPDGSKFPAAFTTTPIKIEGKIAGAIEVFRDATQEKEIDHAKSEFVSLASHQLRTPLSTIGWYTEMLVAGDAGSVNDEQKGYLEEIYRGNRRMVDLVNALLNVSRIELGTFMLTPEPVNFVEIAKSVIAEVHPQVMRNGLNVKEEYEENLPLIPADSKLTRIILQNLITNAVKYTPSEGTVTVKVASVLGKQLGHGNPDEKYVLITVTDTGYGIPEKEKSKIFTKLYRADNVREKETDGSGLGLYLVKSVLAACGGEIWFDSKENQGTSFYVIIPLSGMRAKEGQRQLT